MTDTCQIAVSSRHLELAEAALRYWSGLAAATAGIDVDLRQRGDRTLVAQLADLAMQLEASWRNAELGATLTAQAAHAAVTSAGSAAEHLRMVAATSHPRRVARQLPLVLSGLQRTARYVRELAPHEPSLTLVGELTDRVHLFDALEVSAGTFPGQPG